MTNKVPNLPLPASASRALLCPPQLCPPLPTAPSPPRAGMPELAVGAEGSGGSVGSGNSESDGAVYILLLGNGGGAVDVKDWTVWPGPNGAASEYGAAVAAMSVRGVADHRTPPPPPLHAYADCVCLSSLCLSSAGQALARRGASR